MRSIIIVAALALLAVGCYSTTTNTTEKIVNLHPDSVNLHPFPTIVKESGLEGESGTEMVFPDGSYVQLTGGGAAGNLTLTIMQNDDAKQSARTEPKTTVETDITVPKEVIPPAAPPNSKLLHVVGPDRPRY